MKRRWKWLMVGAVVLVAGFLVLIPKEPDEFDVFRKFGPISEASTHMNAYQLPPTAPGSNLPDKMISVEGVVFTYGPMSESQLKKLKETYFKKNQSSFKMGTLLIRTPGVITKFTTERSVVHVASSRKPSKLDELWKKVKSFFGK